MSNFLEQIRADIKEYQERFKYIPNIEKDEWAFNYWVLDKLFYEDEELIEEKIIDYRDMGFCSLCKKRFSCARYYGIRKWNL